MKNTVFSILVLTTISILFATLYFLKAKQKEKTKDEFKAYKDSVELILNMKPVMRVKASYIYSEYPDPIIQIDSMPFFIEQIWEVDSCRQDTFIQYKSKANYIDFKNREGDVYIDSTFVFKVKGCFQKGDTLCKVVLK